MGMLRGQFQSALHKAIEECGRLIQVELGAWKGQTCQSADSGELDVMQDGVAGCSWRARCWVWSGCGLGTGCFESQSPLGPEADECRLLIPSQPKAALRLLAWRR